MTIKRAEFLTGYEIRRLRPRGGSVGFGAFDATEAVVAQAWHFDEQRALRLLVHRVYVLHCGEVLKEHGWRCAKCRSRPQQFHHIVPRSLGGTHRKENLEPLCWMCHRLIHTHRRR